MVVVAKHRGSAVPRSDASEVPITLLPRRGPAPRPTCSTRAHWSESSALLSDETAGAEASRRGTSSHGQIRRRTAQACNIICSGSLGPRWTRRACPVLCCRLGAWHGMAWHAATRDAPSARLPARTKTRRMVVFAIGRWLPSCVTYVQRRAGRIVAVPSGVQRRGRPMRASEIVCSEVQRGPDQTRPGVHCAVFSSSGQECTLTLPTSPSAWVARLPANVVSRWAPSLAPRV